MIRDSDRNTWLMGHMPRREVSIFVAESANGIEFGLQFWSTGGSLVRVLDPFAFRVSGHQLESIAKVRRGYSTANDKEADVPCVE